MLENDITDKRKERHHITQEDFTPDVIVEMMLNKLPKDTFTNFSRKVLDNSCGIGNFLVAILQRRLKKCKTPNDALRAIKTIYGVELMADNVEKTYGTKRFPNMELCAKSGTAEVGDGTSHSWFTGFLDDEAHPYAFTVLIEGGGSGLRNAGAVVNTVLQAMVNTTITE